MKKSITFLLLFLFIISAKAQPYKTMLPEGRKWVELLSSGSIGNPISKTFYIEKDTIINSKTYKKVAGWWNLYFREDITTGKVWTYVPGCIDDDLLYMDYNLQKGDTFDLVNPAEGDLYDSLEVVDTVFVQDGRKHIVFKWQYAFNEPVTFIEGIGCNYGLFYQSCSAVVSDDYMLCASDNESTVYSNKYYNGQCYPYGFPSTVNNVTSIANVSIFPNPASDIIKINLTSGLEEVIEYCITDIEGRKIKTGRLDPFKNDHSINVQDLAPGLYYVMLHNSGINGHVRFLKK